jgi:serine protease Do
MRRIILTTLAGLALVTPLAACGSGAPEVETSATPAPPKELTTGELIQRARPALGKVYVKTSLGLKVSGTAVLINAQKAQMITNAHVMKGTATATVKFPGQPGRISAKVVGMSECPDLALIQLDHVPAKAIALPFANSDDSKDGDEVVAMGFSESARGWNEAAVRATTGIVSDARINNAHMGPDIGTRGTQFTMISAAIGHGMSGGAVLNKYGEVTGIVTAGNDGADGQGYAIASNVVRQTIPKLAHGWTGTGLELLPVDSLPLFDLFYYGDYGLTQRQAALAAGIVHRRGGMLVLSARPGSSADRRGFKVLDVVTSQNGIAVNSQNESCRVVASSDVVRMEGYSLRLNSFFDEFTRRVAVK